MTQTVFDFAKGKALKGEGISRAANARAKALDYARAVAHKLASNKPDRTITIDDVQRVLIADGFKLGMAAGAVFKGDAWEPVGFHLTQRASSHCRPVRKWRLR